MAASVEGYLTLVQKAHDGRLQLPAFQRNWKWKTSQVVLLFDSLRQGFPIGSFLFIRKNAKINLSPRSFRGAEKEADKREPELLVLDGQQRITAGIELFFGRVGFHYFLDLNRIYELAREQQVNFTNQESIKRFLTDLDAEERYCIAKRATNDPNQFLINKHLLWTPLLMNDFEMDRALKKYKTAHPDRDEFIDFVIGNNFRPTQTTTIPVTTIEDDVTVEAVSRIFSTLNSTGKMLTPFELVVSILYPDNVDLAGDVEVAREAFPYYGKIDLTGDILLQTIALFGGRDTKKASLPKIIDVDLYRLHFNQAVEFFGQGWTAFDRKNWFGTGPVLRAIGLSRYPLTYGFRHS